jgi:hypothetical protein
MTVRGDDHGFHPEVVGVVRGLDGAAAAVVETLAGERCRRESGRA